MEKDIGHVQFIKPQNPLLRPWIKGYYVHRALHEDFISRVTFYQNVTTTLSIYHNSSTSSTGRKRIQRYENNGQYQTLLVGLVDKYQEVDFYGPLDRLGIVFFSAGLNHFLDKPLGELLKPHYSFFHEFDADFEQFLPQVFQLDDMEAKRNLLDTFFCAKYNPLDEPELLEAIHLLQTAEDSISVNQLAHRLGVHRRTLLRKCKKHLGYSLESYRATLKFRRALLAFQASLGEPSLSSIALESLYYDQPDFNHRIKSQTDLTPKQLFNQLNIVDDTLFWKI